ncbi:MAG: AI-2E family transporter, partial [Candidatus Eremiobacteraeota bacterium]|nr:AI-2E family transporter [Candidatus Eremiobacteraeota bacterium]
MNPIIPSLKAQIRSENPLKSRYETDDRMRYLGRAIVVMLVVIVTAALLLIVVRAQAAVLALFGAVVIGEAMRPLVDRLSSRMPRTAAIALSFAALFAILAALWFLPIRAMMPQAVTFWKALPAYATEVAARVAGLSHQNPQTAKVLDSLSSSASSALSLLLVGFLQLQAGLAAFFSTLALMLVMSLFWLEASATLMPFLLSVVPQQQRTKVSSLFSEIGSNLGSCVTGTVSNGSIVALASTVALMLLGAPFAAVLGLLQGLLSFIPYFGTLIGVLAVGGVVLVAHGWLPAVEAMIVIS